MFINMLHLSNFRNYIKLGVKFNTKVNIFEGANGQGKTNLLEAIYFLAVTRSFRTNSDHELINWGGNGFYIKGIVADKSNFNSVQASYQVNNNFQIKVNGSNVKRGDYIHKIPMVVFSPNDLLLIREGPSTRRRFINLEGSRLKPSYFNVLKDYQRVLQQRNRLFKEKGFSINSKDLLDPWDRALTLLGCKIIKQRIALLCALEKQAQVFFEQMTDYNENLTLKYVSSINYGDHLECLEKSFAEQLKKTRAEEIRKGYTVIGPHLDDFIIRINGFEAKKYASQGQQRTAALAIKLGELELFNLAGKEDPIVLLDDVFSEFDRGRREKLFKFIIQRKGQSFLSTASSFSRYLKNDEHKVFHICKGKIDDERVEDGS